jgi:cytochrome c oxidase assembly protein subunit 15
MALPSPSTRTTAYKPALAAFAAIGCVWVFVLVALGAFTTSINAGMAFPDWPLSNGSLNPHGWLTDQPMFSEHAHRLSAGLMTIISLILAIWVWVTEGRAWVRQLAIFAIALCVFQAVVGGLRVLLEPDQVVPLDTSLGQLFAMLHACLAQALVCTLIALAVACSKGWLGRPVPVSNGLRKWGVLCCVLLFLQLGIAAVMRHSFAGLAIPTFPWSTNHGGLLPDAWNFKIGINFAHRAMAAVLTVALVVFAIRIWRDRGAPLGMRSAASALVSLLALQILLGGAVIRSYRDPVVTTAHVLVGAITLATTFWITWLAHRDRWEGVRA